MKKLFHFVQKLPQRLKQVDYAKLTAEIIFFSRFFILVISYLFFYLVMRLLARFQRFKQPLQPIRQATEKARDTVFRLFNTNDQGETASLDLIELAVSHLRAKKSRTLITIGGMSIGFGSVIFLLSLGYGTQRLVISRVARLEEMRQINVTVGKTASLALNEQTVTDFMTLEGVSGVLPLISAVAKVNYNNSVSDVVAYGVTRKYLEESAVQPVQGSLFDDGELSPDSPIVTTGQDTQGRFYGAKLGKRAAQIRYSLHPQVWKPVYSGPSTDASLLGYTRLIEVDQSADEVWGTVYETPVALIEGLDAHNNVFAPWIHDTFPLWKKTACNINTSSDCVDGEYQVLKIAGLQSSQEGFLTETDTTVTRYRIVAETSPLPVEGETVQKIQFHLPKDRYAQLYSEPFNEADLLNLFTTSVDQEEHSGELVYGQSYYSDAGWGSAGKNENGNKVGYWIRASLLQWRKVDCKDCSNTFLQEVDDQKRQVEAGVFIRADAAVIEGMASPPPSAQGVDGVVDERSIASNDTEASGSAAASASAGLTDGVLAENGLTVQPHILDDGSVEWVAIASDSAQAAGFTRAVLSFPSTTKRQAVVNRAMLKVLNLAENQAVGKTFQTVFRLDESFFDEPGYQAESETTDYTIVAVIPDEKTPAFYLPFSDLKNLGVRNYSQLKVVTKNQEVLPEVRQAIESMGFKTASVVDTVGRINSLFDTVKIFLSLLGCIALGVAALGMFNTLTVSLLEKTREVGLMKVIGMKSHEVNRLFLAESIIMGLAGGILGLIISVLSGKLLSLAVSTISVAKGVGYINLVHVPFGLAISIIILSFVIGVATGMYPSRRAMKISALNALRYE